FLNSFSSYPYSSLRLRSISVIIELNRSVIGFQSVNLIEFTDISVLVNYRSVLVNSVSVSVFDLPNRFTDYIIKTFCQLSQHPVVVKDETTTIRTVSMR